MTDLLVYFLTGAGVALAVLIPAVAVVLWRTDRRYPS